MEELTSKANLRDAGVSAGIATDKLLALTGQLPPSVNLAVLNMPSAEEREERKRMHDALDAIARSLKERTTDPIRCFT
jgi:hypothetical protein